MNLKQQQKLVNELDRLQKEYGELLKAYELFLGYVKKGTFFTDPKPYQEFYDKEIKRMGTRIAELQKTLMKPKIN